MRYVASGPATAGRYEARGSHGGRAARAHDVARSVVRATLAAAVVVATSTLGGCGRNDADQPAPATTTTTRRAVTSTTSTTRPQAVVPRPDARVLYRQSQWQVGDVIQTEARYELVEKVAKRAADGSKETARDDQQTIETSWLEKCVEVDADGNRTSYLVYISRWVRTSQDTRDESLKGVYASVSGRGNGRQWKFVGKDAGLARTAAAKKWMNERFGPTPADEDAVRRLALPDHPVGAGETWTPDVAVLGAGFTKDGGTIDRDRIASSAKLIAFHDGAADCTFEASLPLRRLPGVGELGASWTRGGIVTIKNKMSIPLAGRLLIESSLQRTSSLEGEARTGNEAIEVNFRLDETRTNAIGGGFPDPEG
jgi:hypothetical protein